MTDFEVFRIERRDDVAIVWMNRPEKKNAMSPTFFRELPVVLDTLARDGDLQEIGRLDRLAEAEDRRLPRGRP